MTLRHVALSSLFVLIATACSDGSSGTTGTGRGGSSNSGGSSNTGGSVGGGSATGGSGGSGGSTGGSGGSGATGGSGGATGGSGGSGGSGGTTGGTAGTGGGAGKGGAAGTGGTTGGTAGTGGTTGGTAGTGGATGGTGGVVDAGLGGKGGTAGSGGSAGKDAGAGGGVVDAAPPPPVDGGPTPPTPNGTCPEFTTGVQTFNPVSGGARQVTITNSGDASKVGGPLIVYWYATGSSPSEATRGLPASAVAAAGGIIAAPADPNTGDQFPWLSHTADHDALFDEILACAVQKTKISVARVHTIGFSAGGMMTTHLSFARSKYLASVAAYSGGGSGSFQEMNNKFATLVITGGTGDIFGGTTNFYTMGQTWQTTLKGAGHFAAFCDHGGGHRLPTSIVGGVFQFFMDHPYGTNPSPYAGGKIPSALSICTE